MRAACLAVIFALPLCGIANPTGSCVVSGKVRVEQTSSKAMRVVASDKAIVNWHDFSIDAGERMEFVQPHSRAAVLNRVTGAQASSLLGRLDANGKVYLINPHGVVVGRQGVITAASFVASTRHLSNEEFLRGEELVFQGKSRGGVINMGVICATSGDVILIGHEVRNEGSLSAPKGEVLIGAGREVIVRPAGEERLQIRLSNSGEKKEGTGIEVQGTIEAMRTQLQADGNLYALAINQAGIVQATGAVEKEGRVYLVAEKGRVQVSGELVAKNQQGRGGEVRLLGEQILLKETASIDVSGERGGGVVLIGRDDRTSSEQVHVAKGVKIDASAKEKGPGGRVIVWSDNSTFFEGAISVEGGKVGGDGGFAEVSSGYNLDYRGVTHALAPAGKTGHLLLDPPIDLTITFADMNVTGVTPFEPTGAPCTLSLFTLQNALMFSDVTVATGPMSGSPGTGTITVQSAVSWDVPHVLTLDTTATASGGITVNAALKNHTLSPLGALVLKAAGDITIQADLETLGSAGDISITSNHGSVIFSPSLASNITARNLTVIAANNIAIGGPIDAICLVNTTGPITMVVDNASPSSTGPGTFFMHAASNLNSTIPTGKIFIYTSKESQNTINGTLQGAAFTAPTPFVDSDTARWGAFFPNSFVPPPGTSYTVFYKEAAPVPTPTPSGPTVTQVATAVTVLTQSGGGTQSQSTAVTTGFPTQISNFQPLNQPPLNAAVSTYSSSLHVGTLNRPAMTTNLCSK